MRIERVVARAFGPFRDEELRLAPGMTVVAGPNEAGKSTWHAALRLALTGIRRGKGPGTAQERQLAERHRPWDGADRWEVEARLSLADGRTIEIRQDLAGKVDCRAVDVGLGRDVSDEILDGTPDASRWLGLNRDTFASTVSVGQAQILAVTEAADALQEQMQRAAATHGGDATAAAAIARIEAFRRDAVGVDRVGARGPLRTAKDRLAAAEARLAEVRAQHEAYLGRTAAVEAAERRVEETAAAVLALEAELATGRAGAARARHAAAAELAERHPRAPEALAARDALADEVATAIDAWASRPEALALTDPTAADLEAELAALPEPPAGDVEPHPLAVEARRALDLADAAVASLDDDAAAPTDDLPAIGEAEVRRLAHRLRIPQLPGVAGLEAELAAARTAAATTASTAMPLAVAGIAAAAAIALLVLGQPLPAAALALAAGVAGAVAWRSGAEPRRATARVARAEAALGPYREARELAERDRATAAGEARAAGLPDDPAALDELADRIASATAARRVADDRAARRALALARRETAAAALRAILDERGAPAGEDPRAAWTAYETACRAHAEQATAAARREPLARQLEARRAAERSAAAAAEAIALAERRLRAAAEAAGVARAAIPDALAEALRGWQRERAARLRANEEAIAEWERLQSLLESRALDDLRAAAEAAEAEAGALVARLGQSVQPSTAPVADIEARLAERRREHAAEARQADELRGNVQARGEALPDVAEAEEAAQAARTELDRVERLADTLDRTVALLRSAEERVHRNLAPVLAAAIGRWLPAVSGGAYADVSVDPANLAVTVKEAATGSWREARLLSEGTREQIYLLLRVAMAEHLVTNGEVAPLLLDEVTVQSDPTRKRQLLDVLHRLSGERQVVLFTHDDDVLTWAAERLDAERDATVRLQPRAVVAIPVVPLAAEVAEPAPIAVGD